MYTVTVAGTICGIAMEVGDSIIFRKDVAAGTAVSANDITYVEATVSVENKNATLAWDTVVTVAKVEGVDITSKLPATVPGYRVQTSGLNSLINSAQAVGINPAVNGLGYNTNVGTTLSGANGAQGEVYMERGGVEFKFAATTGYMRNLVYMFDGKSSTYIQFTNPPSFLNSSDLAQYNYSATKAYAVGDFVRYTTANITSSGGSDYAWYRCLVAGTGNAPSGVVQQDNTYWEYMSAIGTSYYSGVNGAKLTSVRVRLHLTSSIAYENGVSIYWRTASQKPSKWRVKKIKSDGTLNG